MVTFFLNSVKEGTSEDTMETKNKLAKVFLMQCDYLDMMRRYVKAIKWKLLLVKFEFEVSN